MFDEIQSRITNKNALLLGIGDRTRGDDGVGTYLVTRLQKKVTIPLIDAGDVPENSIRAIEASGADVVLIVDAADFGASPGEIALVDLDNIKNFGVSTHMTNLPVLFRIIPKKTRPDVLLVAIQPGHTSAGKGLSEAVRDSLDGLENLFYSLFKK